MFPGAGPEGRGWGREGRGERRKDEKVAIREKDHGVGGKVDGWEGQERGKEVGGKQS